MSVPIAGLVNRASTKYGVRIIRQCHTEEEMHFLNGK